MSFWNLNNKNLGIDLGTTSILVISEFKGIVVNEPSIIAVEKKTNKIVALGKDAKEMIGKTPEKIEALRPLKHGGIADLKATEMLVKSVIDKLDETEKLGNPQIVINTHIGMTEVEKRAILRVVKDTGAKNVYLIEEPLAAALGAGIDIDSLEGNMIVELGGGTTETAVISSGQIVTCDSLRIAGEDLDENIIDYVKKKLNVEIGKNAAEKIKIEIGYAKPVVNKKISIKGRDIKTGLPKEITLDALQIYDAIRDSLMKIVEMIRGILDRTPPELINSIYENGITLTGGGVYIKGFDELIAQRLGIKVYIANNPLECVAIGISRIIRNKEKMKQLKYKKGM